jgi:hypothetical protein
MSTHTPAPWAVYDGQWGDHSDGEGGGFQIIMGPYDGGAIRHINLINYADGQYDGDTGYLEAKANASLIAAAPELLAALNALMSELPNYMAKSQAVIDARAALAKAGGQP